jgi:hypothetical protein
VFDLPDCIEIRFHRERCSSFDPKQQYFVVVGSGCGDFAGGSEQEAELWKPTCVELPSIVS